MSDQRDCEDMIEPVPRKLPIDRTDPNEPTLPTDNAEATLPIESTDPREPMQSRLSVDQRDHFDVVSTDAFTLLTVLRPVARGNQVIGPAARCQSPRGPFRMCAMPKLMALTGALVGTAILAVPGAAVAATTTFDDKAGDAPARFDITRVKVANGEQAVSVKSAFDDLSPKGTQIFGISLRSQGIDGSYGALTVRRADGSVTTELWRYDGDGATKLDCDVRASWRLAKDVVRLRFPQSCLLDERRVHVSAFIGAGDGSEGDPADWTRPVPVPFD